MGDMMKARMKSVADPTVFISHTDSLWSIPKADLNGFCNDFYASKFMEGSANTCTREISLVDSSDCETILDAQAWTS